MPADAVVCFSTGALLTIGGMLTTLTGAISALFVALQQSHKSQKDALLDENRYLRDIAWKASSLVETEQHAPRRR